MMERYNYYFDFLQKKYGASTRILPVSLPMACPTLEEAEDINPGGCYFCRGDEFKTAGGESKQVKSIRGQLLQGKEEVNTGNNLEPGENINNSGSSDNSSFNNFNSQTDDVNFIAYFQNFPSTYMPLDQLKTYIREALSIKNIIRVVLATRPDCISYRYLREIQELTATVDSSIDSGLDLSLPTVNYHTLSEANCDYGLGEFIDAVLTARTCGFEVGVQIMPDLPADNLQDVRENARILSALRVDNVKIRKRPETGTVGVKASRAKLEDKNDGSSNENLSVCLETRIIEFLKYLDPSIPVLTLQAGRKVKQDINMQNSIEEKMTAKNIQQGDCFDYLQGACLDKIKNSGCDVM